MPANIATAFDVVDKLSWQIQARLAAIVCDAPTREAHTADAARAKAGKLARLELKALERAQEDITKPHREDTVVVESAQEEATAVAEERAHAQMPVRLGGSRCRPLRTSHHLASHRGIVWCWKCGKYGTSRGRDLLKPCKGGASAAGKKALERIREGRTPHNSITWPQHEW